MAGDTVMKRPDWKQICRLLANSKKKLQLKIVDTVFLQSGSSKDSESFQQITDWLFTSKKGDVTKRKACESITLQHVFDRFSRVALTGTNATGPKIVSVGYLGEDNKNHGDMRRVHFTTQQMEREVKKRKGSSALQGCTSLQCYRHPCNEKEHFFRGEYTCQVICGRSDSKDEIITDVLTFIVEDLMMPTSDNLNARQMGENESASIQLVKKEIEEHILKIVKHLEYEMAALQSEESKISKLSADFILDDKKQIWLAMVRGVRLIGDSDESEDVSLSKNDASVLSREAGCNGKVGQLQADLHVASEVSSENGLLKKMDSVDGHMQEGGQRSKEEVFVPMNDEEMNQDDDHCTLMEDKIANLKEELSSTEQLGAECVSKLKTLKSEAQLLLPNEKSSKKQASVSNAGGVGKKVGTPKSKKSPQMRKGFKTLMKEGSDLTHTSSNLIKTEKELRELRDANMHLQNAIEERGKHDDVISRLENEKNELSKRLKDEVFHQKEVTNNFVTKFKESQEAETRALEEVEMYKLGLRSENERHAEVLGQLKSANKVLEAELKSQREYIEELRASSWTDLAAKMKEGIEAVASQELAKSSIGAAQSVASCEERWKRRLEEMNMEHRKELTTIHEEHQNEMRYKASESRIQLEEARTELTERLQKKHSQSLKAVVNHKEVQRQNDLKNELKRYEQIMSEMKARLHSEYQKKHQKSLAECDHHWKCKLEQHAREAADAEENAKDQARDKMQSVLEQHQQDLQNAHEDAERNKALAIEEVIAVTEEKSSLLINEKEKEVELRAKTKLEETIHQMKEDSMLEIAAAVQIEKEKLVTMKQLIDQLNNRHKEEKKEMYLDIQKKKEEMDEILVIRTNQIEEESNKLRDEEIEKARDELEVKLQMATKENEAKVARVRSEANKTIAKQINEVKEDGERALEEAMQEMTQEHEDQIQSMEYELGWMKNQKETVEEAVQEMETKVSEREEVINDLREDVESQRVQYSFDKLFMSSKCLSLKEKIRQKEAEFNASIDQLHVKYEQSENRLKQRMHLIEKRASKFEGKIKLITSTLLNHKRDALMEHKMRSRDVTSKLSEMNEKIEIANEKRNKIQSYLGNLEQAMYDVEKQLQDHSQTSALQGGRINISHARKKRRLDEEYEQILNKIELKRDELNTAEVESNRLEKGKISLNDEMRGLEKSLVGILVEQQKTLLSIASRDHNGDG